MRKIETFWRGYGYSCFWTPEHGVQYYHPEINRDELHIRYGGENYYTSQTGLSGAGYLLPKPSDIMVEFGYYRTDVRGPGNQKKKVVGETCTGDPIFGYAPVANGGLEGDYPIVLTDGTRITFVGENYIPSALSGWDSLPWEEGKEIVVRYMDGINTVQKIYVKLLNGGFYGINALQFADLRHAQNSCMALTQSMYSASWTDTLNVVLGEGVFVIDPVFRYVTGHFAWNDWPEVVNGWSIDAETEGRLFCFRQAGNFRVIAIAINLETGWDCEKEYLAVGFNREKVREELFSKLKSRSEKEI